MLIQHFLLLPLHIKSMQLVAFTMKQSQDMHVLIFVNFVHFSGKCWLFKKVSPFTDNSQLWNFYGLL